MSGRLRLADIGFPVPDAKSYMNLGLRVAEEGETIQTPVGTYLYWSPSKGIEVWVRVGPEGELPYIHGHFKGESRTRVAIVDKKEYEQKALADGLFVAYPNPVKGQGFLSEHANLQYGDGTYSNYIPFVFDSPDFDKYAEIPVPFLADIQLTVFPFDLKCFESEDDWIDWQAEKEMWEPDEDGERSCWGAEAFCPDAMTHQRTDENDYPDPTAFVAGTIIDTAILSNEETGEDFCWAKLRTKLAELDVVAAPDILDGPIVKDGVLTCHAHLSGRIINIPELNLSME